MFNKIFVTIAITPVAACFGVSVICVRMSTTSGQWYRLQHDKSKASHSTHKHTQVHKYINVCVVTTPKCKRHAFELIMDSLFCILIVVLCTAVLLWHSYYVGSMRCYALVALQYAIIPYLVAFQTLIRHYSYFSQIIPCVQCVKEIYRYIHTNIYTYVCICIAAVFYAF